MFHNSNDKFLIKMKNSEKKRKKNEKERNKKWQKKLERIRKGRKKMDKKNKEFFDRPRKGQEKCEKREKLENANTVQRLKLKIKWALFGYKLEPKLHASEVSDPFEVVDTQMEE